MQKLMAIFAHPDDEGAMGGTLARYASSGAEVTLVCGTRGEVGEISDPSLATPETLGEVRQKELEAACAVMGIQNLEFLNYRDSGMVDTPENEDPRALVQADPDDFKRRVQALFDKYEPDVVVTFEPFGWYGHPDHIAVGKWVTEMFPPRAAAGHQPAKLFHAVIRFSRFSAMIKAAVEAGYIDGDNFGGNGEGPRPEQISAEAAITHIIDTQAQANLKSEAMQNHKTQFGPDHLFSKIPRDLMMEAYGTENFIQVYPAPEKNDLFD